MMKITQQKPVGTAGFSGRGALGIINELDAKKFKKQDNVEPLIGPSHETM